MAHADRREVARARFAGKVVVVLGGTSGIGLAAATAFVEEGAEVAITGRDEDRLEQARRQSGARLALRSDLSDLAQTDAAFDLLRARFSRIDVLFVNAGIGGLRLVRDMNPAFWDEVHGIDLRGAMFAAQKAVPLMARGGSILFTGSVGGSMAVRGAAAYAAAKAGLKAASRVLAMELVDDGIRVNMVSPGFIETPLMNRGDPSEASEEFHEAMTRAIPSGRIGRADEVADAVLFLTSSEASYITGTELMVDGGLLELRGFGR